MKKAWMHQKKGIGVKTIKEIESNLIQYFNLNPREARFFCIYYATQSTVSYNKIGDDFGGLSRERTRQIVQGAVKKIVNKTVELSCALDYIGSFSRCFEE